MQLDRGERDAGLRVLLREQRRVVALGGLLELVGELAEELAEALGVRAQGRVDLADLRCALADAEEDLEAERRSRQEMEKLEVKLRESQEKVRSLEVNLNDQSRKNKSLMNNLNFYKNQYIKDPSQASVFKNEQMRLASKLSNSRPDKSNANKPQDKKGSLNFEDSLDDNITGSEDISSLQDKSDEADDTPKYTLFDVEDEDSKENEEDGRRLSG